MFHRMRMVGRLDGYLTGPSAAPPSAVGMSFVSGHLAAFGLTEADLATFHLRQDYGFEAKDPRTVSFGRKCLLARRLAERG